MLKKFIFNAHVLCGIGFTLLLASCGSNYVPEKKFTVEQLKSDYSLMRAALEASHPSLYRYTSRDSMNLIFDQTAKKLTYDMTEREFRKTVGPVFSYIRCGHTNIYASRKATTYYKKPKNNANDLAISTSFLGNKLWLLTNVKSDTSIRAGSEILKIDGQPVTEIVAQMRSMVPSDGYNQTFKTSQINSSFSPLYWRLVGEKTSYTITTRDSAGKERTDSIFTKKPAKIAVKAKTDTTKKIATPVPPKKPKEDKRRTFKFSDKDSTTAILDINTFSDGGYSGFYKKTFKTLKQTPRIKNLIIDLRANGGGKSDASINLMSYFIESDYVVYDTLHAVARSTKYDRYHNIPSQMLRFMAGYVRSKRSPNGQGVDFRFTGKTYKPNKKYGFRGKTYILTNGGSFSATPIFASMVREYAKNITVIGRETGGGSYGCTAMISTYMTLPNVRTKVRIPMYKIDLHKAGKDQGRGLMPDVPVEHTIKDALLGRDVDFLKAYELIKQQK